jgi:hypothetical protein
MMLESRDHVSRIARRWSNQELEKFAPLFQGSVINVSAWKDEDKCGHVYREYFENASEYYISNFSVETRGFQGLENEIFLDLTKPLPEQLRQQFDVVFNHTTLEHIFGVTTAVKTLCDLSRDVLILVVPFMQASHEAGAMEDYWRFTPRCLRVLLQQHGFHTIYESSNFQNRTSVYLFVLAVRDCQKWQSKIQFQRLREHGIGRHLTPNFRYYPQVRKLLKTLINNHEQHEK